MTKSYIVDRFEDNGWAVLEREDGLSFEVSAEWVPNEAAEGDVLQLSIEAEAQASTLRFLINHEARKARLREIGEIRDRLLKGPEGDIEL